MDDIFHEVKAEDDLNWSVNEDIDVQKSSISKQLKLKINVGLQMLERKKNMEMQTSIKDANSYRRNSLNSDSQSISS